jgi:hypothetical protein
MVKRQPDDSDDRPGDDDPDGRPESGSGGGRPDGGRPDGGPEGGGPEEGGPGDDREPGARRSQRPWPPDDRRGQRVLQGDIWATETFAATSLAAALIPDPLVYIAVPVHLVLFVGGCATFLWAYAIALSRSRYETLTMAGVFFLADRVAPQRVTRGFRLLLAIQVVVALVVAGTRPFTALAFAVLVPMLGLGNMALWGARYGTFPPKPDTAAH